MPTYKNYPLEDCAKALAQILNDHPGSAFFQKWTCGGCGERVTGTTANKLFTSGKHEDCGYITDLKRTGCNYMVHFAIGGLADMPTEGTS